LHVKNISNICVGHIEKEKEKEKKMTTNDNGYLLSGASYEE